MPQDSIDQIKDKIDRLSQSLNVVRSQIDLAIAQLGAFDPGAKIKATLDDAAARLSQARSDVGDGHGIDITGG